MGKIIFIDDEGRTHEYDRGIVLGFNHDEIKQEDDSVVVDIDLIRHNMCSVEFMHCIDILEKSAKKDAEKKLKEIIKEGEFGDFMEFMLKEAMSREKKGFKH